MKDWWELLPPPFNENTNVVLVPAPASSKPITIETTDRYLLGVLEMPTGSHFGIQVIHPQMATYPAHQDVFDRAKMPMARPVFIGPLALLPQEWLLKHELVPLLFQRDAMWRPYLDLQAYMGSISVKDEVQCN